MDKNVSTIDVPEGENGCKLVAQYISVKLYALLNTISLNIFVLMSQMLVMLFLLTLQSLFSLGHNWCTAFPLTTCFCLSLMNIRLQTLLELVTVQNNFYSQEFLSACLCVVLVAELFGPLRFLWSIASRVLCPMYSCVLPVYLRIVYRCNYLYVDILESLQMGEVDVNIYMYNEFSLVILNSNGFFLLVR